MTTIDNHWIRGSADTFLRQQWIGEGAVIYPPQYSRAREHSSGMHNTPREPPDVSTRGCLHVGGTGDRGPCAMRTNTSWAMVTWVDRQTRMTGTITFQQLSWRAVNRCKRNLVTITTCLFPSPFFTLSHLMYHLNKGFCTHWL